MFNDLSQYLQIDREKQRMIADAMPRLESPDLFYSRRKYMASEDFAVPVCKYAEMVLKKVDKPINDHPYLQNQ